MGVRRLRPCGTGNAVEVLIDGAEALPAIARELERAAIARASDRLVLLAGLRTHARGRAARPSQPPRGAGGTPRRAGARLGRRAAAALPSVARRSADDAGAADPGHEDPVRARLQGTADALPSREDDRHRRPGRLRRRHRSHLRSRRPLRHERPSRAARASAGTTPAARIEGPAVADVADHFRMRWHEVTGETLAPADPPDEGGRDRPADRPHHPRADLHRHSARRVPDPRVVSPRRSAQRSVSSTSRTSSSGRPRSAPRSAPSSPTRPTPTSACSCCCRRSRTRAATTPAAPSAELIEADDGAGRVLACTLYARSGAQADPIYVHAKIGIVDDAWLTLGSANLNEHSLFNDTEMNIVTHDAAARRARRDSASGQSTSSSRSTRSRTTRPQAIDELWKPISRRAATDAAATVCPSRTGSSGSRTSRRRSSRAFGPLSGLLVDG